MWLGSSPAALTLRGMAWWLCLSPMWLFPGVMSPGLFMDELPMSFPQHHIRGSQPQTIHQVFSKQNCDKVLEASGWVKQDLISCCSVAQSCPTLCNPMDCSTPGFPVLHYLVEFVQSHVHLVSDANQPSLSLSPPSPPALSPSQHQGLFWWVGQSTGASVSASILPMNIQEWFPLGLTGWISLLSKGLSRVFSNTAVQKHQFFGAQPSWALIKSV